MEKSQTELKHYKKASFNNEEELNQKFKKLEKKYYALFNKSTSGIAYHKIIYDSKRKPVNYVITDVNPQYEAILPVKKEDVINKTATEAYEVEKPPYLDIFSKVAETQKSHSFEAYFPPIEKYLKISVTSSKKGVFITVFDDISEQKKAEEKLKESEEKYKKISSELEELLDIIPGSFFCKNRLGEYTRVNQNFANTFNIEKEDAVGKTSYDFFPAEQAEKFHKDDLEVMGNGKPQLKLEMKTDFSTEQRWLVMNKIPHSNDDGDIISLIGLANDVTEQKKSEIKLKDSEKKFRVLFNNATSGVIYHKILYDEKNTPINYVITDVNPQFEKILDLKKENVINKTATEIYGVEKAPYLEIYAKVAETMDSFSFETYFPPMKKYFVISVISHKKGEFITVFDDISERKKSINRLEESEDQYRHLFEDSPFAIALIDLKGKFLECNSYVETLLGYKKEELKEKNYKIMNLVPKDSLPFVLNGFKRLSKGDVAEPKRIQLYKKDGGLIWVLLHTSLIKLGDKKFIQVIAENITEKKKAEDALRNSETRFRALVETTNDWIWEIDKNGCFTYSSPKINDLLGYEPNEIIGKNPLDFMDLDHDKNLEETHKTLFFSQKPYSGLISRCKHKNGKKVHLEASGVPIFDENGKFCGFRGIDRDITKRIEIEQKLRESEENYRELVNDANSIILRWDSEGKIKFINEFGETFFGYSKSGLVGKHIIGTIVPKTETTGRDLEKLMEDICKDPEIYKNNVNENITKYGRKVWISWTNKAIKDDKGNLVGILSVGNDITKQRLATLKISESEDKFRTITEQSFIGIAILEDFKFKYINQQFSDTLGYTPKEILKWKPKEFFNLIHPEDRERIMEIVDKKYFSKNEILADLQFRAIKKTGEVIWLEIISKTIPFEGKIANLIATLDITEKKEAERLVLEENRKLVELNKMRKDIITRVSHELKTPLTSIYGASQILLKHFDGKIDEDVLKFIEIFHRGALRLKKLVENLIDASRIESGKLELNVKMNDLVKITKECVEEMSYLLDSRKLIVNLNLPDELEFNVDKIRLQQVITNLLSNAIKNTPISGKIYVNLVDNHDYIDIQIKDKGVGITEKEKELLFEKFGKMERYGMDLGVDIEGSGLGLYISKEIVELHGGQILVESEGRNKGSTFTIRLY